MKLEITVGQGEHKSDLRERTWGGGDIRENFYEIGLPNESGVRHLRSRKNKHSSPQIGQ